MILNETYVFKKDVFNPIQKWEVTNSGLTCTDLSTEKIIILEFCLITIVQLQFQPYNRYRNNNFRCRIFYKNRYFDILSTSYEDITEFKDQAESFSNFIKCFLLKLKKQNSNCKIYTGQSVKAFYGNFIIISLSILGLIFFSSFFPLSGRLLGIILILLWVWNYVKVSVLINFPREWKNGTIPDHFYPKKND